MMLAKGIGSVFTQTQTISWPQSSDASGWYRSLVRMKIGNTDVPTGLLILLVIAVICAIILNNTKAGRYILCLGSNKEAVRLIRRRCKEMGNAGICYLWNIWLV